VRDTLLNEIVTIDFETEGIGPRPGAYPPRPVGVAIRTPDGSTQYLSWGSKHGDNNCDFAEARRTLWLHWQGPVLFHNAAFDLEVAHKWFGFPAPKEWHDTYFCLFLCYPHAPTYGLKANAQIMLNEPPEERDHLYEWIIGNVPGATKKTAGAFICEAPVSLVGPYAEGDVTRTFGIFSLMWPHVRQRMLAAYDRERRLMPVLVNASKRGIRVDRGLLEQWEPLLAEAVSNADILLNEQLSGRPVNFDSGDEVADALEAAGLVDPDAWPKTETGLRSTAKGALETVLGEHPIRSLLLYRNTAATMLRTFVRGWLDVSRADGRLHCQWHQVKHDGGGARTGRIASSGPNLANVIKEQSIVTPEGFPGLPNLRNALLPEDGHTWLSADYNGQELRHVAHFENGELMTAYQANPRLDLHERARLLAYLRTQNPLLADPKTGRSKAKVVNFSAFYGAGIPNLSAQLKLDPDETVKLKKAIFAAMGGLQQLQKEATWLWRSGDDIVTWGGREIGCPKGFMHKGKYLTFDYKALNMLIQGSAADQTKEALCRWGASGAGLLLSQLYDEINVSVPTDDLSAGASVLRRCMEDIEGFDVPFIVDMKAGPSWGTCKPLPPTKE
jgi:DNA polymerase I-like protein with 3'-5' exonuclease and polymerase domains